MKKIKKVLIWIGGLFIILYTGICFFLYFTQDKSFFQPEKLSSDYHFQFDNDFEELAINTIDGIKLNGVLFKADSSKGLVFFLHGSGGNVERCKRIVKNYLHLNYDLFIMDYRGFGKSEGKIKSEKQFFDDVSLVYERMKSMYKEESIIVIGYSLGTVPAAMIASKNKPKLLVLEAPIYSYLKQAKKIYPFVPVSILIKYKFETDKYVKETKVPILIFHGNKDEQIHYSSSVILKEYLKSGDHLTILEGEVHHDFSANDQYIKELIEMLNR